MANQYTVFHNAMHSVMEMVKTFHISTVMNHVWKNNSLLTLLFRIYHAKHVMWLSCDNNVVYYSLKHYRVHIAYYFLKQ